jgi:hypothetical protein
MRRVLHIRTRPDDVMAEKLPARQRSDAGNKTDTVDLTLPEPDYEELLAKIFEADSVECW